MKEIEREKGKKKITCSVFSFFFFIDNYHGNGLNEIK